MQIFLEIRRRLGRLRVQAAELIDVNNRLEAKYAEYGRAQHHIDPATNTLVFTYLGKEMIRYRAADPNKPIQIVQQVGWSSGYEAGATPPAWPAADEEVQKLRLVLEDKLESYYQNAHRVLKLFGRIPGTKKIECRPITLVRNKLIEHPKDGSLYSFGSGWAGPLVKPMFRGELEFHDEGLVPNTRAFVDVIVAGCR